MKPFKILVISIVIGIFLSHFSFAVPVEIMKLSDIKTGMEGEGKTIFKGTAIETFGFKVLGIIEKFVPGKDLIIVELDSPQLEGSGIIAGMSGSPAYINGKLIGAVAYGFSFSKKPIGGITPIEDIMETSDYNSTGAVVDLSGLKLEFSRENIAHVSDMVQKELVRRMAVSPAQSFLPIKLAGHSKGFDEKALSYLNPIFTPLSSLNIKTNQIKASSLDPNLNSRNLRLEPADAVSIPLIKGDFEYSSVGTVTHVVGDTVYMFGHPFFNLGPVDFPMHKAEVISVVPSYESSFKLASTRQMVGRVQQDRYSAVQGELGKLPYMIPMKVFIGNRNRTFNLELISHSLLTPVLSAISMVNICSSEYQQYGFQSFQVQGKIYIEGEDNITISDLYTGNDPASDFSSLLLAVNYFLMNNREKQIKIQKIDFEINGFEQIRRADIENVLINKKSFQPGEIMDIDVYLNNEKGNSFKESLSIKAPNLKPGATFYLMVADGSEIGKFDAKNVKTNYFPNKLSPLIRAINNLRKNSRLYLKLMTPAQGMFVKGHEYSHLPGSLKNIYEYDNADIHGTSSDSQSLIRYSTIMEYQSEIPAVVRGKKLFKLQIKERSDVQ